MLFQVWRSSGKGARTDSEQCGWKGLPCKGVVRWYLHLASWRSIPFWPKSLLSLASGRLLLGGNSGPHISRCYHPRWHETAKRTPLCIHHDWMTGPRQLRKQRRGPPPRTNTVAQQDGSSHPIKKTSKMRSF